MEKGTIQAENAVLSSEALYEHWQGHRRLTRRVIEAFPEDKLFTYSIGGMRPFSELAMEMIKIAGPGIKGVVTREWKSFDNDAIKKPSTKKELLELWDDTTKQIDELWPKIPAGRFEEFEAVFGQYEGTIISSVFYFIDNEIHHRGQGYVYLRSLGIAPPPFWER